MEGTSRGMGARTALRRALWLVAGCCLALGSTTQAATPKVRDPIGPPYQLLIEKTAEKYRIDPDLLAALVEVESGRRADAISPKGARGLAQLMPGTAERFQVEDPHDPEENLDGAARYLSWLIERYSGDLKLALAAYNAGEGAVDRVGGVPRYPETVNYVRKVLRRAGYASADQASARPRPRPVKLVRAEDGTILITNSR